MANKKTNTKKRITKEEKTENTKVNNDIVEVAIVADDIKDDVVSMVEDESKANEEVPTETVLDINKSATEEQQQSVCEQKTEETKKAKKSPTMRQVFGYEWMGQIYDF